MIPFLVLVTLVCIVLCHHLAQKRGANAVFFGGVGGVFGPFVIPFVLMTKFSTPKEP